MEVEGHRVRETASERERENECVRERDSEEENNEWR